jgi:hypothetical protein
MAWMVPRVTRITPRTPTIDRENKELQFSFFSRLIRVNPRAVDPRYPRARFFDLAWLVADLH